MNYAGIFTDKEGNKYYPDIKEIKTTGEKILSSVGWYRVAILDDPISCLISICTKYYNNNNISATLSLNMANSKPTLNKISAQLNSSILTKVRTTKLNGTYYLEVYYNSNSANQVTVNILLLCGLARRIQMLDFVQAESTKEVMDTIVLARTTSLTLIGGWEPYLTGANSVVVSNGIATLTLGIKNGTQKTALYLPEGFRPKVGRYYPCVEITKNVGYVCYISADGAVQIENVFVNNSSQVFINVSFEVA